MRLELYYILGLITQMIPTLVVGVSICSPLLKKCQLHPNFWKSASIRSLSNKNFCGFFNGVAHVNMCFFFNFCL